MKEMTDLTLEQLERIAARKELERETEKKEIEELEKLLKMPFYLRIQQKGQEETLKRVEDNQKKTFLNYSAKKWSIPKEEVEELYLEYFTEFLNGKVKNIAEFLTSRGYTFPEEKQGKIIVG